MIKKLSSVLHNHQVYILIIIVKTRTKILESMSSKIAIRIRVQKNTIEPIIFSRSADRKLNIVQKISNYRIS